MPGREGQEGNIPISQRAITQQSQGTIKSLLDALVELVTNSDDSYRRLEEDGVIRSGDINVYVHRERGGRISEVVVTDQAEGMTLERIHTILEFAADTSGFISGRRLRGLFGKGLKEAIFALGSGRIESVHNGALSVVELWHDSSSDSYRWYVEKDEWPTSEPNGTRISIAVSSDRILSPTWDILRNQFRTHLHYVISVPRHA